jgi:hypothetical protein
MYEVLVRKTERERWKGPPSFSGATRCRAHIVRKTNEYEVGRGSTRSAWVVLWRSVYSSLTKQTYFHL